MAIKRPNFAFPVWRTSTVDNVGIRIPAPSPCNILEKIKTSIFHENAAKTEPAKNITRDVKYTVLPLKRLTSHAEIGTAIPITKI